MRREHRLDKLPSKCSFPPPIARWAGAGLCLLSLSCGSKGAVAVTAAIQSPEMAVSASSGLAAELLGTFTLHLALGQVAPAGTDVSIAQGNFSVVNAANQATLVVLKLTASPVGPYHLDPGGNVAVAFTVSDKLGIPGQLVTKDEQTALCGSRTAVQIAGSIMDGNGTTPVASDTFALMCN
jgi:hypothetical protein